MDLIIFSGNVGKEPEMRYTPKGQPVTSFSVAVNRKWTDENGEKCKETKWYRVSTWGKLAEVCNEYVKKGMKVLVQGRLTCDKGTGGPRLWTRQDGSAGSSFEVTATSVEFLSSAGGDSDGGGANIPQHMDELPPEDDIPF